MPYQVDKPLYDMVARRISRVLQPDEFFDIEEAHSFLRIEQGDNVVVNPDGVPPDVEYPAGTGYKYSEYIVVRRCRVTNKDAAPQTVIVYYGSGAFLDTRVTLSGSVEVAAPSTLDSLPDVAVGAGATVLVSAAASGKKYVTVGNPSATVTARYGDAGAGAANGQFIFPLSVVEIETSGDVYVYNPSGGAISFAVEERSQ